jgi:putative hemolysin
LACAGDYDPTPGDCQDFHTLAGFMLSQFEQIPTAGDHFEWEGFRFEVVDMDG